MLIKKQANVSFAKQSDATKFVEQFNNLTLDGTPMQIKLSNDNSQQPVNAFNPFTPAAINRGGMFGSALQHNDNNQFVREPSYSVTITGGGGGRGQQQQQRGQQQQQQQQQRRPAGGRGGKSQNQGHGRGAGSGGARAPREAKPETSASDLNNALDSYFSTR